MLHDHKAVGTLHADPCPCRAPWQAQRASSRTGLAPVSGEVINAEEPEHFDATAHVNRSWDGLASALLTTAAVRALFGGAQHVSLARVYPFLDGAFIKDCVLFGAVLKAGDRECRLSGTGRLKRHLRDSMGLQRVQILRISRIGPDQLAIMLSSNATPKGQYRDAHKLPKPAAGMRAACAGTADHPAWSMPAGPQQAAAALMQPGASTIAPSDAMPAGGNGSTGTW